MAKKVTESGAIDIFKTLQKVDNSVEIIEQSVISNINDWIPTGNYLLNACISGDMFKGVPAGRILTLAGPSGCAKSFLACSICREAQKKGYTPVYLDTEGAIDKEFVRRLGCDTSNFIIKQVNLISDANGFIANMCKSIEEQMAEGKEKPKIILVIDSIGNMTSDKEKEDVITGNQKADFTKAKEIKALFRVNTVPLARLDIPLICTNHVVTNLGSFVGGTEMVGGVGLRYAGSITLNMTVAKLVDKENDKAASKKVGAETIKKNGVLVSAAPDKSRYSRPVKVKFSIPFYTKMNPYIGLEQYLNWENAGVCMGKCLTEDEYTKLKPDEQLECLPFEFEGETKYTWPKKTMTRGVGIVCKHLGRQVTPVEFYSPTTFTDEFMKDINERIIRPFFELPDQSSNEDIKELMQEYDEDDE